MRGWFKLPPTLAIACRIIAGLPMRGDAQGVSRNGLQSLRL
jgi:hypothetical protein